MALARNKEAIRLAHRQRLREERRVTRTSDKSSGGVALPEGYTGSSLFHHVLLTAAEQFPKVFDAADFPRDARAFKREYGTHLARFEAARVAAPERLEIARSIVQRAQAALEFADQGRRIALSEHFAETPAEVALSARELGAEPGLRLEVPFEGKRYRGQEVRQLIEQLTEQQQITLRAREALRFMVDYAEQQGGVLDLRGHSFALLGAGAELAPTRLLLAAGARVLWVDVADPASWLSNNAARNSDGNGYVELSGTLVDSPRATHLLENPAAVAEAIRRFAGEQGPVHLGMFAYAPGASQEWRLGAAMNAIASRLDASSLRSISMLVSPTSAATLQPECVEAARAQLAGAPRWKSALCRAGALRAPGHYSAGDVQIALATVSVQGLSYQAAQYISKVLAAESYAVYGVDGRSAGGQPLTVSANVAGITRTRSMSHPIFQAAFAGASSFGVHIFDPDTTRALNGLLILHDLLNPAAAGAAAVQPADPRMKASALLSQQVHGGLYNLAYVLEQAIRVAALIGMGRDPSVLVRRRASAPEAPASR